jgi:hypothetical protein
MRSAFNCLQNDQSMSSDEVSRLSDIILFVSDCNMNYLERESDPQDERIRLKREISLVRIECLSKGIMTGLCDEDFMIFMETFSKSCHSLLDTPKPHESWVDHNIASCIWNVYVISEGRSLELFSRKDTNEKVAELWQELVHLVHDTITVSKDLTDPSLYVNICSCYSNCLLDYYNKGVLDSVNKANTKDKLISQPKDFSVLLRHVEEILKGAFSSIKADTISLILAVNVWNRLQISKAQSIVPLDSGDIFLCLFSQLDLPSSLITKGSVQEQTLMDNSVCVLNTYHSLPTLFHIELSIKVAKQLTESGMSHFAYVLFKKCSFALTLFRENHFVEQVLKD